VSMQAEWAPGNQRNTLAAHSELVFLGWQVSGPSGKQKTRPKQLGRDNQDISLFATASRKLSEDRKVLACHVDPAIDDGWNGESDCGSKVIATARLIAVIEFRPDIRSVVSMKHILT